MVAIIHFDGENRRRTITRGRLLTPSYPTAATTGLAGVGLTVGDLTPHAGNFTTTSNGQVVELLDISGSLIISHDNVLVRKCRIVDGGWWVVDARNGNPGFVLEDCLVDAQGDNGGEGYIGVAGLANVYRCDISNAENAIVIGASGVTIQANYLHHFRAGSGTPHYDGIENNGGASNIDILGNTIDLDQSDTSTVNINNDFGPVDDVRIAGNRLLGGGYTLTIDDQFSGVDEVTNVQIVDNRLGEGALGYALVRSPGMISEESGNIDDVTGEPVSL